MFHAKRKRFKDRIGSIKTYSDCPTSPTCFLLSSSSIFLHGSHAIWSLTAWAPSKNAKLSLARGATLLPLTPLKATASFINLIRGGRIHLERRVTRAKLCSMDLKHLISSGVFSHPSSLPRRVLLCQFNQSNRSHAYWFMRDHHTHLFHTGLLPITDS